ncbi:hypothetical protein EDC01DRAFT_468552 [Geopyxis carbonaria]|nr:hypothetical protein EDC01DRAFT_468552 [Geopyxis carbonaria]
MAAERVDAEMSVENKVSSNHQISSETSSRSFLCSLPTEILLLIAENIDGHDLARLSCTCRKLSNVCASECLWAGKLERLSWLTTPAPYKSFKALYEATHYHLWLYGKLWHSDRPFTGSIAVAHYNAKTGNIDLCSLLANSRTSRNPPKIWTADGCTHLFPFNPVLEVWHDPLVSLSATSRPDDLGEITYESLSHGITPVYTSISRARAVKPMPGMSVWPPLTIPAADRTRNVSNNSFRGSGHKPRDLAQASPSILRLRKWMQFARRGGIAGMELANGVETFNALDPSLWTPTAAHPWRGLWVGDYFKHGAEIVLLHQSADGSRLEAIKLTGDPNVPRGELTWRVPDLAAVMRTTPAWEVEWPDAQVVAGEGQLADTGYKNACWVPLEVILAAPDKVVAMWDMKPIGVQGMTVSVYRRIRVEDFLSHTRRQVWEEAP